MRDSVVGDVAVLVRKAIGGIEFKEGRAETRVTKAWEDYQRARQVHDDFVAYMLANGVDAAELTLRRADSLAQIASRQDPHWIAPVILRGKLAAQRVQIIFFRGGRPNRDEIRSALDAGIGHANHAVSLDKTAPDGYELRGLLRYRKRLTRAIPDSIKLRENDGLIETDLVTATTIDSTRAEAWSTLSELYMAQSRFLESRTAAQHAYETDRYFASANDNLYRLALSSFETRNDLEARKWCSEGRRRFPAHPQFVYCQLMVVAWADTGAASVDSAWALVRLAPALLAQAPGEDIEAMFKLMVASLLARAGAADSARNVIERTRHQTTSTAPALLWLEAAARARLGDFARADSLLSIYVASQGLPNSWVLNSRALKPLRDEHLKAASSAQRR
jgi:tetratricopeptide (TPR) repeat protein